MARGNGRQLLFHEDRDYQRMTDGLCRSVARTGWDVLAYVWMPNHIHLFIRTPQPNLSKGMQYLLSGYANWYAKRHERSGHLFQGRFKGELIENSSYFWNVSRYIHLNPVRGKKPLVSRPQDWRWSSYRGFARQVNRVDWIAYDDIVNAFPAEQGTGDPLRAYRRFVESAVANPPTNPLGEALEGWLLGSDKFLKQIKRLVTCAGNDGGEQSSKVLHSLNSQEVIAVVANFFNVDPVAYGQKRATVDGRDLAAYLCHRRTTATLRDLAKPFGLNHPDSVSNIIRRVEKALAESKSLQATVEKLDELLMKTENRV
jgi:putative transposase